ncbi:YybH family protein [Kribbella shirazensis]|uniref:Ketosteroid isomerase-like protein n=1 Tax=Kribbella shirazensis TaxID=1105143 RepID=A0A7X6A2K7_9ACTN|nr:nuclear transport factor 2 family protein [Kribbella shirazensis]NIK59387.1 ketosteroid isomerase-like protein [Kribbella shirazensis]
MAGARTPEELESMFEDAFVLHDQEALAQLFEPDAVLRPAGARGPLVGPGPVHGRDEIQRLLVDLWDHQEAYVADPQTVLQLRGTALVISRLAVNVVRRTPDGRWRYAIVYLGS